MQSEFEDDPGVRWMRAWQEGDEAAFDALVEAYSPQVYALLTRFLGQRANREDLVQEVFLRVVRARERYEPSARFSTFLFRIAYNLSVNETQRGIAREAGRVELERAGDERRSASALSELEDERTAQPGAALERDDVVREVRAAIARLPENQRMALLLAKYEELPYGEIAEVLGSSEKAVKSLIHRARESLRESLSAFLEEEEA
jgi:RNA polymerase sigma-70 factor (ECF subfamily)